MCPDPAPILVGVALDERDAAPVALGRTFARLTTGRLALLHAYPYEPLTMPVPEYTAKANGRDRVEAFTAESRNGVPLEA